MDSVWAKEKGETMKMFWRTCLGGCVGIGLWLAAGGVQAADGLGALRAIMDPVENLQGEFHQVISDRQGETLQESSGRFGIKRPGYFYWRSEEPFPQTIVGTPDKLWIYDPDLEQATVRRQTLSDASSPVAILTGDPAALDARFEVAQQSRDEQREFILTPKHPGEANYREVAVVFRSDKLAQIRFVDKLEQTTKVTFASVERNGTIEPDQFEFTPPPGTDIVRDDQ